MPYAPQYSQPNGSLVYHATDYGYDAVGRVTRVQEPSDNITRMLYDARGLVVSEWLGTDDEVTPGEEDWWNWYPGAPLTNLVEVAAYQYDNGADGGDGNLTRKTEHVDSNTAHDRVTTYGYDLGDRLKIRGTHN